MESLDGGTQYETHAERDARIEAIKRRNRAIQREKNKEKISIWVVTLIIFGFILYMTNVVTYQVGENDGIQKGRSLASTELRDNPDTDKRYKNTLQGYCNSIVDLPYGLTSSKTRSTVCRCVIETAERSMKDDGWTSFADYWEKGVDASTERSAYQGCV